MHIHTLVEQTRKGDVIFYAHRQTGKLYQSLGGAEPFSVRDGSITYKTLTRVGKYHVKYNNNGVYGYAVADGLVILEGNIWSYAQAVQIATQMQRN